MKKKVAVFFGGKSCEHDISIITALQAMNNLDRSKYEVCAVYIRDGFYCGDLEKISEFTPFVETDHTKVYLLGNTFFECSKKIKKVFKPDVALLCTHGGDGENGCLQGLLEMADIPYTSANILGSAVCMNKALSKQVFENMVLNVVKQMVVYRDKFNLDKENTIESIESVLEYPVIVKPSSLGSSIGIEVAKNRDELEHALMVAICFDNQIVVERALVDFLEINCAVVSDGEKVIVSQTECPVSWNSFLTYEDKYMSGGKMSEATRKIPAPVAEEINNEVRENAKRVYTELGLKGVVRIDYMYDKSLNKVFLNEINTIPGSLAFYLFEPLGISYKELLDIIIEGAFADREKMKKNMFAFSSSVLKNYSGGGLKK
ncbi:MAG: D-alanine--D-alanine ligase [Clostridia bacterium]|nr:D-alanine--D-alanine ligase [Clostridia bacterium]